jgi:hypothetical protein
MMTPGIYNFPPIKQGATFKFQFNWQDELGATVDLTGYTARLSVGYENSTTANVLEVDTAGAATKRIVLGGTPFNIVGVVDKATMLALTPGNYVWDLELTSPSGEDYALLTGRFPLQASKVGA